MNMSKTQAIKTAQSVVGNKTNQRAMREIETVLKTCNTPAAITAGINQVISRYGATETVIKTLNNGLQKVAIVDRNGFLVGEYTRGPEVNGAE